MSSPARSERPPRAAAAQLRRAMLAASLLLLIQAGIGMVVNLYVSVPRSHPGAQPGDFFTGAFRSVVWALGHGALALAIHAALGVALVAVTVALAAGALRHRRGVVAGCCTLAALLVIGAGFNGASFLSYNLNVNSLIMALLSFGALLCYLVGIAALAAAAG